MLAGLTAIPPDVYDAARIDGAGEWRILRHITLPLLSPTLFFLSIVSVIGAFQTFNSIYVMTDPLTGGPLNTTRNITMLVYLNFYEFSRLGLASAIAFLLFFIVLALTVFQMRVLSRKVHYQN
ncbi:MAG: sugar ABC transporter permease [Chloroflexi bacterium]|nr:sugar ABC transporter permease [Chloroflexota bacterium]